MEDRLVAFSVLILKIFGANFRFDLLRNIVAVCVCVCVCVCVVWRPVR